MRKNLNTQTIEGYVYSFSKPYKKKDGTEGERGLHRAVTGPSSKNPGTPFISGEMVLALDDEGTQTVVVHFTYVTEKWGNGKVNTTYNVLEQIIDNPKKVYLECGTEATKVKVEGSFGVNDFLSRDGEMVASIVNEGRFVNIIPKFDDDKTEFQTDMFIEKVTMKEANPETNIDEDYLLVSGYIFDWRNALIPISYVVRNKTGMSYFDSLSLPFYTKVWGHMNFKNIKSSTGDNQESAWGEVITQEREYTRKEWMITGTAKVPYELGEETVLTSEEMTKALQDREILIATTKKEAEERTSSSTEVKKGGFNF